MSDFRGARGSNTGDDFHELWAARHAIRLLDDRDPLQALTVEGIAPSDEVGSSPSTWDGVDCALYEGGGDAKEADRILLEQLKYSAANPRSSWTVARMVSGDKREDSVLNRLAKAWAGIQALEPKGTVEVSLVTNQPIAAELIAVTAKLATGSVSAPRKRPGKDEPDERKMAFAAGLSKSVLPKFAKTLRFNGGAGSRFAIEKKLLADISGWTDLELQAPVSNLRQFIRQRMRPEFAGELITKESVLLELGVSTMGALFPCPPVLERVDTPVPRSSVADIASEIAAGKQRVCLHGPGGVGKTTALQQIEALLPPHSIMVTYDCYGAGTYLDAATLRHRHVDAFLQLSNELATRLRLPILLSRHQLSDPPRLFSNRLGHAAQAHASEYPDALIVIAVDAADNAVTAATTRKPPEACFVHDFLQLGDLPPNVRFIVTARTGRLAELALPSSYKRAEIQPFTRQETEINVRRKWAATDDWIDAFHRLTMGVPRVQAYAMDLGDAPPDKAIDRLLPAGRSLDQVFREQFERALGKNGIATDLPRFCAGLIALARPVPIEDLSKIIGIPVPALIDICTDMAPAIRLTGNTVGFADEDFEHFVREAGEAMLSEVTQSAADWLLSRCESDSYAAQHVAGVLAASGLGNKLLDLVEREPSPAAIDDPVKRREAELTRLRLAISFCRGAGDSERALRFVLIGGEGLKTERALRTLLSNNPDLAVRFAADTAGRLVLTDPKQIGYHGAFLLHKQVIDSLNGDQISLHEGQRLIEAWMAVRKAHIQNTEHCDWRLEVTDVAASVEAALRSNGPESALQSLWKWKPKRVRLLVARYLIPRLIAQDGLGLLEGILDTHHLKPWEELFVLVPLAVSGAPLDNKRLAGSLRAFCRRWMLSPKRQNARSLLESLWSWMMDVAMTSCELLAADPLYATDVDGFLDVVLLPENRRVDKVHTSNTRHMDLLLRAHALRAARTGEKLKPDDLYETRPEPAEKKDRRDTHYQEKADRKLNELTSMLYPIYAATAIAMSGKSDDTIANVLEQATRHKESSTWRLARDHSASALAMAAARCALLLVGRKLDPDFVLRIAKRIHGRWGASDLQPDLEFAERMMLRPELRTALVLDIDAAASAIRTQRIGARDKSQALLTYSRLLLPFSPDDANAVFHDAIDADSQLDREIVAQLRLLGQLFKRVTGDVEDRRVVARDLCEVLVDAAVRLDGDDNLPWKEVMETVAALDLPLALANTARWQDANLVDFSQTLGPVLKSGLSEGTLDPAAAMALELMLPGDHAIADAALDHVADCVSSGSYLEEAAWNALVRHNERDNSKLLKSREMAKWSGQWSRALRERQEFLESMEETASSLPAITKVATIRPEVRSTTTWTRDNLLNGEYFANALTTALQTARTEDRYVSLSDLIATAAERVEIRDRLAFLKVLRYLKVREGASVVEMMLLMLDQWNTPAIRRWAASELPEVIVERLPDFARYIGHGETSLPKALKWTGLGNDEVANLLLRGVEQHGQMFDGEQVFALAGLIAEHLDPHPSSVIGVWYANRLAERVSPEDRDQTWQPQDVPVSVPASVARFLYACLGDYDVRVRWRAAHGIRRLARLDAAEELKALIDEYGRRDESIFRSSHLDFFWIAARMWFVIAWDRIAAERVEIGAQGGALLLAIALDQTFPHLLLISFARDACLKLVEGGAFALDPSQMEQLNAIGRSALTPLPRTSSRPSRVRNRSGEPERRFQFDPMDTVPYWYDPMLDSFANVSQDLLLTTAETWIIDRWGYPGEIRSYEAERKQGRISSHDWALTRNDHGASPTLERLSTHLEWHALWCSLGELLRTEPLAEGEHSGWSSLSSRVERQMLTQPPCWSADLLGPVPLRSDFWRKSEESLAVWVEQVSELRMRSELIPTDCPGHILVGGEWRLTNADRVETLSFSSALVEKALAGSLIRALQTMESSWDYSIPTESEDSFDGDDGDYQMIPWLSRPHSDGGVDSQDPLRGNATLVSWMPANWIIGQCGLERDPDGGNAWSLPGRAPMFRYDVWGDRETDENHYQSNPSSSGCRLLTERNQLRALLQNEGVELVIVVEVRREGRSSRRGYDSEEQNPQATYARVYRLDGEGRLYTAEGRIGSWESDCPSA
ncbi:hypothetical protein [Pseudomonas sp. NPDC090208]|uniref:hypothetical protein n=1 Tax=Pseudomonas sp. NPDC090208 TaxID=3364478 RepID=UPI00382F6B2D